jgi:hypothetical protein
MREDTSANAFHGVTGFAISFAKLLGLHKYLMECDKGVGSCSFCTSILDPFFAVGAVFTDCG